MNNNKKNQYLEMFLNIADELLQEQKIKSRRDFPMAIKGRFRKNKPKLRQKKNMTYLIRPNK